MNSSTRLLYDYSKKHPNGYLREDVERDMGWSPSYFQAVKQDLRRDLRKRKHNLVYEFRGPWGESRYYLTSDPLKVQRWRDNRLLDGRKRNETVLNVIGTVLNSTTKGTMAWQEASVAYRSQQRALQDITHLLEVLDIAI